VTPDGDRSGGRPLDRIDRITLTGLTVRGRHGVFEHERRDGQDFVVDAVLHLDTRQAAAGDDLTATVHYGELAAALAAVVRGRPVDLIETLAARLVAVCLADPRVAAADVTVHKPAAPIPEEFTDVAVTVHRTGEEVRVPLHAPPPDGGAPVVLALGSNLGDGAPTLGSAVAALAATPGLTVTAVSPVVRTEPVGGPEQPPYLNAVVLGVTALAPLELLAACVRVEQAHGRTRSVRWGPRTLDVDVVDYAGVVSRAAELTLPHPRAAQRAFVLAPWLAVDPGATLSTPDGDPPVPVRELLAAAPDAGGVRPGPDLVLGGAS